MLYITHALILTLIDNARGVFCDHFWQKCAFDEIFITGCTRSCQNDKYSTASDERFIKMKTFLFHCVTRLNCKLYFYFRWEPMYFQETSGEIYLGQICVNQTFQPTSLGTYWKVIMLPNNFSGENFQCMVLKWSPTIYCSTVRQKHIYVIFLCFNYSNYQIKLH